MTSEDNPTRTARRSSFFSSLRALLTTFLDLLQTRLDLVVTELEEERERLRQVVLLGAIALFFAHLGIIFLTFLVVAIFWETHRLVVVGGFALLYLGLSVIAALTLRHKVLGKRPFSATVAQLAKDRDHLRGQAS